MAAGAAALSMAMVIFVIPRWWLEISIPVQRKYLEAQYIALFRAVLGFGIENDNAMFSMV